MRGARRMGAAACLLLAGTAFAGGPRWVTGPPYFQTSGVPVAWGTKSLQYFTDPGDLSGAVNHGAADAMVATAAAAWNVPVASMVVSRGGALAEDVSGTNVYMGSNGPVFPADVQASNAAAIPVAVIYDADGAVTDTLLGGGASDPGNCRQAAVTESVDGISVAGKITHALLVLNGRCTGAAPELQMEMTYRLVRAFGRILGVGWSQLNDNVFTGVPQPTYVQAQHWPVMHPIDLMCGPYAYQCLPQPLVLRPDDVAAMVGLYPESGSDAGKTASWTRATPFTGTLSFPNGQGMAGVNVVTRRWNQSTVQTDGFEETSAVTGALFQQAGPTPVAAKGTGVAGSQGQTTTTVEGRYDMPWVPVDANTYFERVTFTTQAVNPLYTGQYAVGPYGLSAQVTPSGQAVSAAQSVTWGNFLQTVNLAATSAVASCTASGDGTEAAPAAVAASGMWQGAMCGYGHTAWTSLPVKGGRSLTVEVTAVDEQGLATVGKMQPVFGVWASTDARGTMPTVASAATPMNTATLGMTAGTVTNATARTLRIGFGDQRGDGRPDYGYKARVLYADSVAPVALPSNGGQIVITGMGFRNGNAVLVNGVAAQVLSWSANQIVALAPAMTGAVQADVTVMDVSTMGQTTMTGAIAYSETTLPDAVAVVSVPADGSALGVAAGAMFAVKVTQADGVTPAVGVGVSVSATNSAALAGCGGAPGCVLTTDGGGMVRTAVVPGASGMVALGASVGTVTAAASFMAGSRAADVLRVTSLPGGVVYAGVPAGEPLIVQVLLGDGVTPDAGAQVSLTAQGAGLGGCGGASSCVLTADASGMVATTVTPAAAGVVSLRATAGAGSVSASFGAVAMPADVLRVVSMPGNGAYVGSVAGTGFEVQALLGDGVTPAVGAAVTLNTVGAVLGACGGVAACVVTADGAGMVSTAVTPTVVGTVLLSAAAGGGMVQRTFTAMAAPPDRLEVVSVPANGLVVGAVSAAAFGVRLYLPDGVTPVAGAAVTLTATGGVLTVCGAATCVVTTDATGMAASSVMAAAAGTVGLKAAIAGLSVSNSFTAVADSLRVVSLPPGQAYVGVPTRGPVVLQVLATDGVTPAAGVSVTVRLASPGSLGACGLTMCVLTADAQGMVSTLVTPTASGAATIQATAGGGSLGTSFGVAVMPPDVLKLVSAPTGKVYTGVVAALPLTIQVLRGDGVTPDPTATMTIMMPNVSLPTANCDGGCFRTGDANGVFTSTVFPKQDGTLTITANVNYAKVTATFVSVPLPADVLTVVSAPVDGAVPGRVASPAFAVKVMLGDGRTVAANTVVTLTATGATLGCGLASCAVRSDATGMVSTAVTPTEGGTVGLTAAAGGGTVSASFLAVVPPDVLRVVSAPADGALAGRAAVMPFQVKVMLADGVTAAAGAQVTMTASGGTLGVCGLARCVVTAGASGVVSTAVTPTAGGTVSLTAAAGGGAASASFLAVVPPDGVTVVSAPANGTFAGRAAGVAFGVKVLAWDGTPAAGVAVTLTASNAALGACGAGSCVVTADANGAVSTTVTPVAAGVVGLTASAAGGTASASFTAAAVPADTLTVISVPANGGFVGRAAGVPFAVKVMLGDGTVGAGAAVSLTAIRGTLGACGSASCVVTADANGMVSTTVTPGAAGLVALMASAGGGTVSASFTAVVVPADVLTVVSVPANGGFVRRVAGVPFAVKVMLGDGTVGAGATVSLTAVGGTLGSCGSASCVVTADANGMASTTVTPQVVGAVALTAAAGGGTVAASFTAAAVPADVLTVVSVPANGAFVGRAAAVPFAVKVSLWDGTVAAGAAVTVTASNGVLGACGASSCVLTADAAGMVSTTVTPAAAGLVGLTAAAGGGTVSASFTAAAVPPDTLTVVSVPGSGGYVGRVASGVFGVKVMLGDGTVGAGAQVTLTAVGGTLAACGSSSCVVTADASGMVATAVTPQVVGVVEMTATAGGGAVSASLTAVALPADLLTEVAVPASGGFAGEVAGTWRVRVMLGDGVTVGAGAQVTMTAANGVLGVCGAATCVVVADAGGMVSSTVTAMTAGVVGLWATAGGGVVASTFTAVDHVRTATMAQATEYVAAGAVVSWTPRVSAALDGVAVTTAVSWTGGPGMVVGDSSAGSDTVVIGPLAAGATAAGQACVWGTTCASFGAVVVDEGQWGIVMVSGGGQAVGVGGTLAPVVARVVDGAGHGVAGAQVTVRQRVNGYVACPAAGRCPVGPVLGAGTSVVVSDVDGLVSVAPLVAEGTGETTGMVFVAGLEGYWSTEVSLVP